METDLSVRRRVPAEWEPQSCIWLAWPHNRDTWPGYFDHIPTFFSRWIASIAESTPVRVLAGQDLASQCESAVGHVPNVEIVDVPTDDCWIRDYGPTFVVNEIDAALHAVNWRYNAWGEKYPPWDKDNEATARICDHLSIPVSNSPLCLEGGAIETDGGGRLITSPGCLITQSRNPGWDQAQIESELSRQLGVSDILWLSGGGLAGDDTDGHVDQLVRFIDRENVVAATCPATHDENYAPLQKNLQQLREWASRTVPRVTVHELDIPPARHINGQRVPESYCNFLRLGPDRIQLPTFGAVTDQQAKALLAALTGATIEPIDCRELVWGLGALHCASRDQPLAAPFNRRPNGSRHDYHTV